MKHWMRTVGGLALVTALAVLTACTAGPTTVGVIVSLTGPAASYGQSIKQGLELALGEINGQGGVNNQPLQLDIRDCQSSPETGQQIMQEFIEQRLMAVIGADASDVTLAIAPLAIEAKTVLISPASSSPRLSGIGAGFYRNYPSDQVEAQFLAQFLRRTLFLKDMAIIAVSEEYGRGMKREFTESFKKQRGNIVDFANLPSGFSDEQLAAAIEKVQNAQPPAEAVYLVGYTEEVARMVTGLRAAGVTARAVSVGAVGNGDLPALAGEAAEGLIFPMPAFDPADTQAHVQQFVQAYTGKFGQAPDLFAAHAYDALHLLAPNLQEAQDSSDIMFSIQQMGTYEVVAGATGFNGQGDTVKPFILREVRDGQIGPWQPPEEAAG